MPLPTLAAFAASPEGKKVIASAASMVTKLVGGLFKGHSDWYYTRQHRYGWNINSSGDKAKEFGADVWDMWRKDLKVNLGKFLNGDNSGMNEWGDGADMYLIAKTALPYKSQYFDIKGDDELIQLACQLLNAGILPTDNKIFTSPDLGGEYNKSWVKYQVDNVAAIAQLKQTDYWKQNYVSAVSSTLSSVQTNVSNAFSSVIQKASTSMNEPVIDETTGKQVVDANGVLQYKTKTSVWVIICIVAACIVCLGFVGRFFKGKGRKR